MAAFTRGRTLVAATALLGLAGVVPTVSAEEAARLSVESARENHPRNRNQEIWKSERHTMHARALARLGRLVDARAALEPALQFHQRFPDISQAEFMRIRRAYVRLAQALANPGESRALLTEAAELIDGMSPEYRRTASVVRLRNEIAVEIAARR